MIWPSISYLYKYNQHICSLQANFHQIIDPENGQKLNYFFELHIQLHLLYFETFGLQNFTSLQTLF